MDARDVSDDDDSISSEVAIEFVESASGYTIGHVTKECLITDLVEMVAVFRSQLDELDTDESELSVFESIKRIIVAATALGKYAKHFSLDLSTYNQTAELQLRAERKAGQWLTKHLDK